MIWEIRDEKEIIYSGSEEYVRAMWEILTTDEEEYIENTLKSNPEQTRDEVADYYANHCTDWTGDIELLEVHNVHR